MANYLYNGAKLPDINTVWTDEVKKQYPFAVIYYNNGVGYRLCCFSKKQYFKSDNILYFGGSSSNPLLAPLVPTLVSTVSDGVWGDSIARDNFNVNMEFSVIGRNVWSSFDMEYDGTLYLAASLPVLADSKLSVSVKQMMSYNGTVMPPLPEWDDTTYPYAVIGRFYNNSATIFAAKDTPFTTTLDGGVPIILSTPVMYLWNIARNEWVVRTNNIGEAGVYVWSNHNLYNSNAPTKPVHEASDPVLTGEYRATFTCTNLNETDSVYKISAWCYPKGADFQTAPHTYTSAANFPGTEHSESWSIAGLRSGVEYDLYACIMVDGLATDHNALATFTAEGAAELPDFTETSLYVSDFDCTETTADFGIGWRNLPFIEQPNAVVYYISAELDDGSKQIVDLFYSDEQREDGVHSFPTFEGLSPGTMYTMTARLLYSKTADFSGYTDSGVYVTYDFTTPGKKGGYDRDSFLLGFASGLGCTAATKDGAEYNTWAQGYVVGSALRKAL